MVFGGILNESIYESIRVIRSFTLTNIARNFPTNRCDPCTILTGRRSLPLWSTTLQYVDEIALTVDVKSVQKCTSTGFFFFFFDSVAPYRVDASISPIGCVRVALTKKNPQPPDSTSTSAIYRQLTFRHSFAPGIVNRDRTLAPCQKNQASGPGNRFPSPEIGHTLPKGYKASAAATMPVSTTPQMHSVVSTNMDATRRPLSLVHPSSGFYTFNDY
ncbi:hypothetical protein RF11_13007 [Thelohanellus kitauei]|uniref:Uncharacterized protein n=1 Tax=Thelohanellus kitauei TaxID=669202 RepID=A0A0C2MIV7_THEKT|nr:hypothetical protein RF11_13007 [Thelohanellus kitauei]